MERIGEQKEQIEKRNLLTDPEGTIRAMAQVEGPAWLEQQDHIEERLNEENISESTVVEDIAHVSVPGALRHLQSLGTIDLGEEPHVVYNIYGTHGIDRWFVFSDGTVRFSDSHAASPEHLQKAQELGFELSS